MTAKKVIRQAVSRANLYYRVVPSHCDEVDMKLAIELFPFITMAVKNSINVFRVIIYCRMIADCGQFLTDRFTIANPTAYIYHSQMNKE